MMPTSEFATITPPNNASRNAPAANTMSTSTSIRPLNRVNTLARRISVTVREGAGGTALVLPWATRVATSAAVRPLDAPGWSGPLVRASVPVMTTSSYGSVGVSSELGPSHLPAVDLVGPVREPQGAQPCVHPGQREVVADPGPPWAWMARSTTRSAMFGTTTLMEEISTAAPLLPTVSIRYAA